MNIRDLDYARIVARLRAAESLMIRTGLTTYQDKLHELIDAVDAERELTVGLD